ncbi:MAG TPA: macrolide family glycosyltransferase [Anaerolineae bacterium]|nr:macrolide family glycosyltransferase [Anaerolineae bacterium]
MSTIAYVGLPAHGHTNPSLPVIKELVNRGHTVHYYNAESFRPKITPTGAHFHPFPPPMPTEREIAEALHKFINASLIMSRMAAPLARFLIDTFTHNKPDLVIYDSAAMWGYVAARTHNIPNICFITTFVLDGSQSSIGYLNLARFFLESIRHIPKLLRWRRAMAQEFGSDNAAGLTAYADCNIVFTSRDFHPPNNFIDDRFHFVGPSLDPQARDGHFPFDQLDPNRTTVYVSLGTINHLNPDFYRNLFTAFTDHPAQFILAAGRTTNLNDLGPIPPNFIVQNYVPQLDILQRADYFITHGGMNSVHEGLYYGVPQIVIPNHFEQYLNGKQVATVGAGRLIGTPRTYGQATPDELRQALTTLSQNPSYHQNAQKIGQTLRDAGGYQRAATLIEQHLHTPLPIPS